jgi:hypothetical protein
VFDLQCESAFCVELTNAETQETTYECSEVYSLRNPTSPCTSDTDCAGDNKDKTDSINTECLCGYSQSGNGYCDLLPGDEPYAKFIELYTAWYDSGLEKNCNTARRGNLECAEAQWDYENFFALQYYLLKTSNWAMIWDVQSEVQLALGTDYWAAKQEYELHLSTECSAFKGKKDSQKFTDTTCAFYVEADETFYVDSCDDGYSCTAGDEPTANYTCVADSTSATSYPGEYCEKASDCFSNVCASSRCKGTALQATCALDTDCDPGLFCDSDTKKCATLLAKDAACSRDAQCDYDNYCHINVGETTGTCTAYFSVASSQEVNQCRDEYVDYQCSSGYCVEHVNESTEQSTYYCSEIFSLKTPTQACTADVDCAGTNADKSLTVYSSCSCGYSNDGSSFCQLLPGDEAYASYLALAKKWYLSGYAKNCNTARRGSLNCALTYWDYLDYYAITYYAYKTQYWNLIWKVDTEVQVVLGTEYWDAKLEYELHLPVTCSAYKAKEDSQIFTEKTCVHYIEDEETFYVQGCDDGFTCTPGSVATANYTCVQDVASPFAYPGEACTQAADCISGTCTSGFCKGTALQATCALDTDCDPGLFCDSSTKKCATLLSKDSACTRDWQCEYDYYCHVNAGETTGTCTAYFGVASYETVNTCRDDYFDYQCSTGYCVEHVNESTDETSYVCSETFSLTKTKERCYSDSDCAGTSADKSLTVYSTCSCGYSEDGSALCELLPGDDAYASYTRLAKNWYLSGNAKNCNTARRGSFDCAISHWDSDEAYALAYYATRTMYWNQIWNVQTEVQKVFATEYWDSRQEYYDNVAVECTPFVAKESTQVFTSATCVYYDSTKDSEKFYVTSCEDNYECQPGETQPGNYTCVAVAVEKAYPGEKCATNADCASGACTDLKCVGVAAGGKCASDDQCDPGLYCDTDKTECTALLAKDQDCASDSQCDYDYYCHFEVGDISGFGKCAAYFSVTSGTQVAKCSASYIDLQCESAFCVTETNESTGSTTYTCSEPYTVQNEKKACTSNVDCYAYNSAKDEMLSTCACGLSQSGEGYCELLPGNDAYSSYISYVKSWFSSGKAKECNTVRRGSLECAIEKWDAINFLSLQYFAYRTAYWTQIWNVQSEIRDVLAADYWDASYEYELHEPVECSSYKCKTSSQQFTTNTCSFYDEEGDAYYLKSCSKGYSCTAGISETSNSTCTQNTPTSYAGPGEDCDDNTDCYTGLCNKGVCLGQTYEQVCVGDKYCNAGLYCNEAKICVELLKADAECTRDEQCTYGYYCYVPYEGTAGKCTTYMNLKAGTQLNSCKVGSDEGLVDHQCETGHCIESYDESLDQTLYYCSDVYTQVAKTCDMNADCSIKNSSGVSSGYGECDCGKSQNGYGYCSLYAGDDAYASYIKYYKKWLTSTKTSKCNTTRRGYLGCAENFWDDDDYYSLAYYTYKALYWRDIQDVATCTRSIFATEYWSAKEDLEDYEDDSAFSLMFAAIFALVLLF